MDFVPNTEQDREEMLKEIGVSSVKELFKHIPNKILLKERLRIPRALSELELKNHLESLSKRNKVMEIFCGAGSYNHFIPSVVNHIISRSEFYTAYTPYQPEISQGILQAIYEYQTMICELTGMGVANASLYDGASALAESCIMAVNITGKKEILMSRAVHPEYRETVKTYCHFHNIKLEDIELDNGVTSLVKLKKRVSEKTAAVIVQSQNFFGCIENLEQISNCAHEMGALSIGCLTEPTSLGILRSPGSLGVDIFAGEGQSLGNAMNFGGPYLGIIATKEKYMRYIPGRIVGATLDADGRRGYVLNLQAREQHIRREKASSNICSNEALCALAATVYLAIMGKNGMKELAELNLQKAHYAFNKFKDAGFEIMFNAPFYNEFVVKIPKYSKLKERLSKENIFGGIALEKFYPEMKDCVLFCVTEMNSRESIDKLVELIKNGVNI